MFTGIIEELGEVESVGARLKVRCSTVMTDMIEGASIAVNGVCLTAVDPRPDSFSADLAPETLRPPVRHLPTPHRPPPASLLLSPRPCARNPAPQQPGRPARRLAREPRAAALAGRPLERPHRAGPRRRHGRVALARGLGQ